MSKSLLNRKRKNIKKNTKKRSSLKKSNLKRKTKNILRKRGGANGNPETEEPVNPQVQKKKEDLIEIYTERMVTTSVPWIPGIFFLYSYLLSERSRKQKLFLII